MATSRYGQPIIFPSGRDWSKALPKVNDFWVSFEWHTLIPNFLYFWMLCQFFCNDFIYASTPSRFYRYMLIALPLASTMLSFLCPWIRPIVSTEMPWHRTLVVHHDQWNVDCGIVLGDEMIRGATTKDEGCQKNNINNKNDDEQKIMMRMRMISLSPHLLAVWITNSMHTWKYGYTYDTCNAAYRTNR